MSTTIHTSHTPPEFVDFGATAVDYGKHRAGLPDRLFDHLRVLGLARAGQRVVDLGAGTGAMARPLAALGCDVIAVDRSGPMLDELGRLAAAANLSVARRVATAEDTGLAPGSAELVTATTCWHWFDGAAAAREAHRLLVPGGLLLISTLDWRPGAVLDATLGLLDAVRGAPTVWPSRGLSTYASWPRQLDEAGFVDVNALMFDCEMTYARDAWRGRMRASTGFLTLDAERAVAYDASLAEVLAQFPERFPIGHRCFVLTARRAP